MSSKESIFCLPVESVEAEFHETYITTGYRKPGISFKNCVKSIFIPWCNESFNVWSHAIFGLYFCVKYWKVFTEEFDVTDPFVWPLFTFAMSMIGFCFMSSIAHTFNSMSSYWRHKCFYLDYAAISIYTVGLCQSFYFYTRPLQMKGTNMFLAVALLLSMTCTLVACLARTRWRHIQYTIRTFLYTLSFILASSPLIYRLLSCKTRSECECRGFSLYCQQTVFLLLSALTYACKIPERYVSQTFDCLGQSHHFFHIFTTTASNLKFEFIKTEILDRREVLIKDDVQPTFYTTLLLSVVALVSNLLICYFVNPTKHVSESNGHKKEK